VARLLLCAKGTGNGCTWLLVKKKKSKENLKEVNSGLQKT
jgi:hypothetical protein